MSKESHKSTPFYKGLENIIFKEKDFDPDNFESKQPKAVLIEFLQNTVHQIL